MSYLYGLFGIANMFIAVFICVYAWLFLSKTTRQRDRRPWDFLFVSSVLFLLFELISFLSFIDRFSLGGLDMVFISKLFEFLYSGLVLLAFVSQHDLIMKSHLIFISKKEDEAGVEVKIQGRFKPEKGQ